MLNVLLLKDKLYMKYVAYVCQSMFSIGLLLGMFLPTPVEASLFTEIQEQNTALSGQGGAEFTLTSDPRLIATRVVRVSLVLFGFIFFMYTLYGGSLIAFSQGKEDDIRKGKSVIVTGTLGVVIILSAYGITTLVNNMIMVGLQKNQCTSGICWEVLPDTTINNDPLAPQRRNDGTEAENFWRDLLF